MLSLLDLVSFNNDPLRFPFFLGFNFDRCGEILRFEVFYPDFLIYLRGGDFDCAPFLTFGIFVVIFT